MKVGEIIKECDKKDREQLITIIKAKINRGESEAMIKTQLSQMVPESLVLECYGEAVWENQLDKLDSLVKRIESLNKQ